jgi:predicted metalloendopeptidase
MKTRLTVAAAGLTLATAALLAQQPAVKSGIDTSLFDTSVRPQDDLFRYVNGGWLEKTDIPADRSNYGTFTVLAERAEADLYALIEELAGDPDKQPGSTAQQVGDLYASFMDTERLNELGAAPLTGHLADLEWMTPATRAEALEKLSKFRPKIGYPPKWRDYTGLEIAAGDLVGNVERATRRETEHQIGKLDRPVDLDEWLMTPQTVNAYYHPIKNEIVFPAAILQPPFFDVEADDAVNYGSIGAVIGHEIGHGFDDQGRRYDGDGKLRDWWQPEDEAEFQTRASVLVDQFSGYSPVEGMTINGALTLGENIGDLGGLSIAYQAWKLSLEGRPSPVIDDLTGEQRFFMGWVQAWRSKARDEYLRQQVMADPHAAAEFRANGPLGNIDAFYEAFDVRPGDALYRAPADRVRIW